MIRHKALWQRSVISFCLGIIIIFHLLVPVNPDGTLPAIPELAGIALLSGILCFTFSWGRNLQVSGWSFRPSEVGVFSFLWLTVLFLTGTRAFISLFKTPGQLWTPCLIIPNINTRIECFFQATTYQNYGVRTFFMLLTAVMMGTLACLIVRSFLHGWKLLLGLVVFGPLLVTLTGFFCLLVGIEQVLPKSLLYNAWGSHRLTQIFGNPGWAWPYFAPGIAIVLWATVTASTRRSRILWAGISFILILGALATQQAGALLLCLIYITVCGFYYLSFGLKKSSIVNQVKRASLPLFIASILLAIFSNQKLLQQIAKLVGYEWDTEALSPETTRLEIWKAAWNIFKEAPLFGHGYASWLQIISEYGLRNNRPNVVFDTAHNLFFQILVEFGLLHTVIIFSFLGLIAFTAFQNSRFLPGGRLLFLLAVSSFFVPTLVQEINYIRPSYYIHAIFWGALVGLPFHADHSSKPNSVEPQYQLLPSKTRSLGARFIPAIAFALLSGVSLLGILFCYLTFSFGGYQFEAALTAPNTKIMRWLGPNTALATFATAEKKSYSVYDVNPRQKPMTVNLGKAKDFSITVEGTDRLELALENGGQNLPRKHNLSFFPVAGDGTRWIGVQVAYPPVQSNLGIAWSRNMYGWETFGNAKGRWCGQNCVFLVKTCSRSDRLDFSILAPRPVDGKIPPSTLHISVYGFSEETQFSQKLFSHLPIPLLDLREQFDKIGTSKLIHVQGTPKTSWYLVWVESDSVFNPKSLGISPDDRNLTAIVQEASCPK
ncbi:O-antigen ligase family protein [Funiculus sociatus GB2-A5]|uniref:O-antigen ligase family protein n=1 Tax=Funiculus sociatus GB2-A5 TaxID=2933946 RepID=A0ABV0JTM7_9CYAN|nr:O-antigen ligase family protein [Trichocoleus sp. FACHB-832]MBD2064834.1 O-antigen ligase family protein [Trichocoleus sp. FACHB-6]